MTLNTSHASLTELHPHWSIHGSFEVNQSLPVMGQKSRHHYRSFDATGLNRSTGARDTPPVEAVLTFNEQGEVGTTLKSCIRIAVYVPNFVADIDI